MLGRARMCARRPGEPGQGQVCAETGPPRPWGPGVRLAAAAEYERRRPEETVLYRTVAGHLATFVEQCVRAGSPLPARIVRAFERFLSCGILSEGFSRVRCEACGRDSLVAFSCKQRGICPSCAARRAADTAAWLVDRVLPEDPIRQWTVSLPFDLRLHLARDGRLRRRVLDTCLEAIFEHLRAACERPGAQAGSVTFVQSFSSTLQLNVHFHCLVPDGVYVPRDGAVADFVEASPLLDEDVARVAARIHERVGALLRPQLAERPPEPPADAVGQLQAASLAGVVSLGERAGRRVRRRGGEAPPERIEPALCALAGGFSIHAGTRVGRHEGLSLERLCRYGLRGPLAESRLEQTGGERVALHLRRPLADGTTMLLFEPLELLERLAALIPKPGEHGIHFHGVLAAHAAHRAEVVPPAPAPPLKSAVATIGGRTRRRLHWAELLARVFAAQVLVCPFCGGPRRIIATIEKGPVATQILRCLGLPTEAPPRAAARGPPQGEFAFDPAAGDAYDQRVPDVA